MTRAVLDAAADLFARNGPANASLRDIARAANVQVTLIARYLGSREQLIQAVFADLTTALAQEVIDLALEQTSFERDSTMGRWTALLTYFVTIDPEVAPDATAFNPVDALVDVIETSFGLDPSAARLRATQILASALGWRTFESYLLAAGDLSIDRTTARAELTALHRRIGATPWPSPEAPLPPDGT